MIKEQNTSNWRLKLEKDVKNTKLLWFQLQIGCLGGDVDKSIREVRRTFENDELAKQIVGTMQKTVLMDSETTLRKIFSGLIQLEES